MSAYGSYIVETFVTLVAVCAIAFVVLYGAKRLGMGKSSGAIQLVGQLPLDARRCIYLVKVGGQVLVVGVGEGGFTKLAEMPESAFPGLPEAGAAAPSGFADVLARLRRAKGEDAKEEDS
ncbi:flagellar biosynthetic protein FliO [Pendulispora brunnea]|uniref:Flagellar biosynthetic protein FliO n=1 Tax=Pendulispora brunnea TaxID=2905690 RepID=A0ABZ2K2B2_9BACT